MPGASDDTRSVEALSAALVRARSQAEAGDLTGARADLETALATAEVRLGRDHPRLAPVMVDLATIARELGNVTEAQRQLRRAYQILRAVSGPDDATVLAIEGRLATLNHRLGEPTDAFDWHLADAGARVLGSDHTAVRDARARLGAHPTAVPPSPPTPKPPAVGRASTREAGTPPSAFDRRPTTDEAYAGPPQPVPLQAFPSEPMPVEIWPESTGLPPESTGRGRRIGVGLVAVLLAVAVLGGAVVAVKVLGGGRSGDGVTSSSTPTSAAPATTTPQIAAAAPSDVSIEDQGGAVVLTWRDPSAGRVPFLVTGGRIGTPPQPMQTLPPGRTRSIIYGLNASYNYCFTVTAVYSTDVVASSPRMCTHRVPVTPTR